MIKDRISNGLEACLLGDCEECPYEGVRSCKNALLADVYNFIDNTSTKNMMLESILFTVDTVRNKKLNFRKCQKIEKLTDCFVKILNSEETKQ